MTSARGCAFVDRQALPKSLEGRHMAYGVVHKFAGGTKEQYEASIAAVHPEGGGQSPAFRVHCRDRRFVLFLCATSELVDDSIRHVSTLSRAFVRLVCLVRLA